MYELDLVSGASTGNLCYSHYDPPYGCVEPGHGLAYPPVSQYITFPHGGSNPMLVDMEHYYLYNVLPREMDVKTYQPTESTLPALKAQALAARSVADWKAMQNPIYVKYIINATNKQVFVPGSFDYYNPASKDLVQRAVDETSGQYPSYGGMSIDAEFSNDIVNPTRDGTSWTDYLVSVQEPISPSCDLSPAETRGNGWGMSQKGAMRWAKGNQCAGSGNQPWPVTWTDYRQILVHYYTGIDILNASGGKVAPDDRWNLLNYNLPNGATVTGANFAVNVMLQNASTSDWNGDDIEIGYHWGDEVWHIASTLPAGTYPKGKETAMFATQITEFPADGTYTLHLDLRHRVDNQLPDVGWFSKQGWLDAKIEGIKIIGSPTATPTPTSSVSPTPTILLTSIPIAQGLLPTHLGNGPAMVTTPNLMIGKQYRIIISGVAHCSSLLHVDAQWNDNKVFNNCFCKYWKLIEFNGITLAAENGQAVYDPKHAYTFLWQANTTQLQMRVVDTNYADNYGNFTYQIFDDGFALPPTSTATP